MNKDIQRQINKKCTIAFGDFIKEYSDISIRVESRGQLRRCKAEVFESENYIFLKSYNTIVAFIDKKDSVLYDVLRYVYRYSSTSSQHISKFSHDYYNHVRFTYYPCQALAQQSGKTNKQ